MRRCRRSSCPTARRCTRSSRARPARRGRRSAARSPRPRAILIASAHWETNVPMLTGNAKPETIHDFGGFPPRLYRLRYPGAGRPRRRAARAVALLEASRVSPPPSTAAAGSTTARGCRSLHMYPQADDPGRAALAAAGARPAHHFALGRALAPLADEGVLIVGSGHMTHNLRDWMRGAHDAPPAPYAKEFAVLGARALEARRHDALVEYRSRAPHAARAHPTDEHFLPLFFALGAAGRPRRAPSASTTRSRAARWRWTPTRSSPRRLLLDLDVRVRAISA